MAIYRTIILLGVLHTGFSTVSAQDSLDVWRTTASEAVAAEDWEAARKVYDLLLKTEPESGTTWFNAGLNLHELIYWPVSPQEMPAKTN
jgi:hypothetical protein